MSERHSPVERWREQLTPVTVDGLRTWVLDEGLGNPVVFLHGIPTHSFLWRDVASVTCRTRRTIAPDLLGFGLADRPAEGDYSPDAQAAFVARALDELGVPECALAVHDYGALVGAALMAREPKRVTHLVVLNTSLAPRDWGTGRRSPLGILAAPVVGELAVRMARPFMLREAFKLYMAEKSRMTSDVLALYWYPFSDGFGDVLLRLVRNGERWFAEERFAVWQQALRDFRGPALVIWGQQDRTFRLDRAEHVSTLLHGAPVEVFEHASHFVPEDRPEALARLIGAFLDGRYGGG